MKTPWNPDWCLRWPLNTPEGSDGVAPEETIHDRRLLVGADPFSECLAVIPLTRAIKDVALIRTLSHSNTLGMVRKNQEAWALVAAWENDELERDVASLPDDTPFDWEEWFGPDFFYLQIPLARLRTAELCPEPVLDELGQEDHEMGMDHEQAIWLSPEDRNEIEQRLTDLGYEIVHNDELLRAYSDA
jgi:hypothetical protein